ncbi:MAG: nuclear transport factor 2 family protein [Brevundimonas sp.]
MSIPDPAAFASTWVEAWNSHDLEAVLALFADDVVFTSPLAQRLLPDSGGTVRGKDELRRYWSRGLELIPDLHFTVERVFAGVDALVVQYRNQRGGVVDEVLRFDDGLVVEGHGTYLVEDNPAT